MKYFVCFCYEEDRKVNFGNAVINTDDAVTEYKDIQEIERRLGKKNGIDHPIVLDYKLLGSPAFEYTRCGDIESVRVTGNGMTLAPDINVSVVSGGGARMSTEEVAREIRKAFISQISKVSKGQE